MGATWAATRLLVRLEIYDRPNERSSHDAPKPRGGGLALIPLLLVAWAAWTLWSGSAPAGFWAVLGGAAVPPKAAERLIALARERGLKLANP